jgi:hypothetical protein
MITYYMVIMMWNLSDLQLRACCLLFAVAARTVKIKFAAESAEWMGMPYNTTIKR